MADMGRREFDQRDTSEYGARARAVANARAACVLAALLSAGLYVWLWPMPPRAQLAMLAASGFVALSGSTLALSGFVLAGWVTPLLTETAPLIANDALRIRDVVSAISLLLFVLFALRSAHLHARPLERRQGIFRRAISHRPWPATQLRPLSALGLNAALACGLALALLWALPLEAMAGNTPRLIPAALRGMIILWGFACLVLILSALFAAVKWRRLSPQQAAVYIRRVLADELGAEQAAIERARVRLDRQRKTEG